MISLTQISRLNNSIFDFFIRPPPRAVGSFISRFLTSHTKEILLWIDILRHTRRYLPQGLTGYTLKGRSTYICAYLQHPLQASLFPRQSGRAHRHFLPLQAHPWGPQAAPGAEACRHSPPKTNISDFFQICLEL